MNLGIIHNKYLTDRPERKKLEENEKGKEAHGAGTDFINNGQKGGQKPLE